MGSSRPLWVFREGTRDDSQSRVDLTPCGRLIRTELTRSWGSRSGVQLCVRGHEASKWHGGDRVWLLASFMSRATVTTGLLPAPGPQDLAARVLIKTTSRQHHMLVGRLKTHKHTKQFKHTRVRERRRRSRASAAGMRQGAQPLCRATKVLGKRQTVRSANERR